MPYSTFHGDGTGKNNCVRNDNQPAFRGSDDRGARLNIMDRAFDAGDADEIADAEWLLQQQENASEKILQDVLERESDSYAADAQNLNQV